MPGPYNSTMVQSDNNRLFVENLASGREEVVGRFGDVVVHVPIDALGAVHGKTAIHRAGVGDLVAHIILCNGKVRRLPILIELYIGNRVVDIGAQCIRSAILFQC